MHPPAVAHGANAEDHRSPAAMGIVLLLVEGRQVATDHHAHQTFGREIRPVEGADIRAVPEDGDAVRELVDLGHPVADVDDGEALGAQLPHECEQRLGFAGRQGRGRFVHHEDAGIRDQGAGDLHELALGHRQLADLRGGGEPDAQSIEDGLAGLLHRGPVDHRAALVLAAEQHVLGHRQVRGQGQFLIDDRDAVVARRQGAVDDDRLAVDHDLAAGIGLIGTGQDLHQGRLAGPVLAHQRMDLPGIDREGDVRQSPHAREGFRDVAHGQDRLGFTHARPPQIIVSGPGPVAPGSAAIEARDPDTVTRWHRRKFDLPRAFISIGRPFL